MSREKFLKHEWDQYPILPKNWQPFRVRSKGESLQLASVHPKGLVVSPPTNIKWLEILRENDLVALSPDRQELLLLAPSHNQDGEPIQPRCSPEIALRWQEFLQQVRDYFLAAGFLQVQTPILVESPGTEPYLNFFETEFRLGSRLQKLFLPTSPELHLKKLLASDWNQIFEIQRCFRNDEVSPSHQPEFSMLEWYRAYEDLRRIEQDVFGLVQFLKQSMQSPLTLQKTAKLSMRELFLRFTGKELCPDTARDELAQWVLDLKLSYKPSPNDSWDELFFAIFVEKIEPKLLQWDFLAVHPYPPQLSALARKTSDGWADRMEIYLHGLELANGFHELNDPKENRERLVQDQMRAKQLGKTPPSIDEEFLKYLEAGMPPSAGIALGLDRLFQKLMGIEDIAATRPFPKLSV